MTHKHEPIILGAAKELHRTGRIETFDAVYRWVCPDCGYPQRTTRLADTIYALRHAYGWDISTEIDNTKQSLAAYVLVKAGDMPGRGDTPHPRRLVRDAQPERKGYADYPGVGVPVEAVPTPKMVACSECKWTVPVGQLGGQVMLGGWVQAKCQSCSTPKNKVTRIFRPV